MHNYRKPPFIYYEYNLIIYMYKWENEINEIQYKNLEETGNALWNFLNGIYDKISRGEELNKEEMLCLVALNVGIMLILVV